jgi:hypothetical protein
MGFERKGLISITNAKWQAIMQSLSVSHFLCRRFSVGGVTPENCGFVPTEKTNRPSLPGSVVLYPSYH